IKLRGFDEPSSTAASALAAARCCGSSTKPSRQGYGRDSKTSCGTAHVRRSVESDPTQGGFLDVGQRGGGVLEDPLVVAGREAPLGCAKRRNGIVRVLVDDARDVLGTGRQRRDHDRRRERRYWVLCAKADD